MDTRIPGAISQNTAGVVTVNFVGGTIKALGDFATGARVIVCIRPEEIALARLGGKESSAGLNSFTATVANVSSWLSHNRVELKCEGVSVIAFVQRARFLELALRHGDEARVFFQPTAAHLIAT